MGVITGRALAALIKGMDTQAERLYVAVKDPTGHRYTGHVADLLLTDPKDDQRGTCTIVADDGEVVWKVDVRRLLSVDVRPRPTGFSS